MKIIDRYIFKEFITPFSYCFFTFILLFIVGDLFENLDDFIKQGVPWQMASRYYLFLIPSVFVWTAPLAILLSLLYELGYMSRHNELSALKASGVSFWRIVVPFGLIGMIFSMLVFGVNERLIPSCTEETDRIRSIYVEKTSEKQEELKNITFFSSLYNVSFYIDRLQQDDQKAEGVSIREFYEDGSIKREWYGETGLFIGSTWWLFNGYVHRFSPTGKAISKRQPFKKQEIFVNIPPHDLVYSRQETEKMGTHMNFHQLHNYIKRNYIPATFPKELVVDLYRKLSMPVTILVVTLFGVAFGARISKGGALASVGASIGVYLIYYGASSFLIALGKMGKLIPVLAVWTPQVTFGIIGGYLLKKIR